MRMKRIIALLAAVVMVTGMFAGCAKQEEDPKQESTAAESSTPAKTEEKTEEKAEEKAFSYPMDGKKLSLAVDIQSRQTSAGYEAYGDTEYAKAVEAAIGVEMEYVQGKDDWFSLLVAEGDYPDVMESWWSSYPGGLEAAAADGVIIPLNDVIDQYMPNFKAFLEKNPQLEEAVYSGDGNIYGIPYIYENTEMLNTTGLYLRADWLKELGLEVPTTIEEWHTVLTAFKEQKGVIPYALTNYYILNSGSLRLAYIPSGNFSIDPQSGKIVFSEGTEGWRDFLTEMNRWYEEGLIDPDLASLDFATITSKMTNNELAATWGWNADLDKEGIALVAAPVPAKEEGAIVHMGAAAQVSGYAAAISSQCEDLETAARYLDWFWSEEGILMSNFGIENVSYTVENGVPAFTDEIMNNPDGLDVNAAFGKYIRNYGAFPGMASYEQAKAKLQQDQTKETYAVWGSVGTTEYKLPAGVKLGSEENDRATAIMSEVSTYVSEMSIKFILGTEDIEAKWDEYVKTLSAYGIEEAVALYQSAYDAYLAK